MMNFVKTQCHMILMGLEDMTDSSTIFSVNVDRGDEDAEKDPDNHFQASISPGTEMERLNDLPFSPTNFLQQFKCTSGSSIKNGVFLEGSYDSFQSEKTMMDAFKSSSACGFHDMETMQMSIHMEHMEPQVNKEHPCDENKGLIRTKRKASQADSVSDCSDQIDDDDDDGLKYPRKVGKGAQSKNIDAERRRRKKLNERLYALRSLVPKISKVFHD